MPLVRLPAGCAASSPPSLSGRFSRLGVLLGYLTPHSPSGGLLFVGAPYPLYEGDYGAFQVPQHASSCELRSLTPAAPLGFNQYDPLVLASGLVTPSPLALSSIDAGSLEGVRSPLPPIWVLCVRFRHIVRLMQGCRAQVLTKPLSHRLSLISSVTSATLDTGGCLGLDRWVFHPARHVRLFLAPDQLAIQSGMRYRLAHIASGGGIL